MLVHMTTSESYWSCFCVLIWLCFSSTSLEAGSFPTYDHWCREVMQSFQYCTWAQLTGTFHVVMMPSSKLNAFLQPAVLNGKASCIRRNPVPVCSLANTSICHITSVFMFQHSTKNSHLTMVMSCGAPIHKISVSHSWRVVQICLGPPQKSSC